MRIGLILHRTPAYSETFFNHKIKFLQEAGHDVILFVEHNDGYNNCKVKTGFVWKGISIQSALKLFRAAVQSSLHLRVTIALFTANRRDGFSLKKNLLSILSSAHIPGHGLHWIHYGFAETAIRKENLAQALGSKMAVSVRGYDLALYPLKRPGCYQLVWKKLDKLHHLSDHLLQLAIRNGLDTSRIETMKITPAVEVSEYENIHSKSTGNEIVKIVTIARLHWIKGLDDTLLALSLLKDLNFEYHVLGDGPELERLLFLVNDLSLQEKVFFHGKQSQHQIRQHLKEADLYIQYSEHEGFCNALLEAQASGLLCIAGNASALKENILHEKTGFLTEIRNPQALADTIQRVLDLEPEVKNRICEAARERIRVEFSINLQKEKFLQFYSN